MSLALLIASIVASALTSVPGIPSGLGVALNAIVSSLGVIIKSGIGSGTSINASVVLATLSGIVAQLKTQPGLSQAALADIQILADALQASLTADAQALVKIDPTLLHQETPVA
jgi:hypothetical protein